MAKRISLDRKKSNKNKTQYYQRLNERAKVRKLNKTKNIAQAIYGINN